MTELVHTSYLQELDLQRTPLGQLLLRRHKPIGLPDTWVYAVTLGSAS